MDNTAATLGAVAGTIAFVAIAVGVLLLGLSRRRAGKGSTVFIVGIVLTVVFSLAALNNLARIAAGA